MKKAYIHIGLEKTGTTALQIFLQHNPDGLANNNLVYLGDDTKPYVHGIGHFPIVASFYDKCPNFVPLHKHRPSAEVLEALSQDVADTGRDIILSCEHFSSRLSRAENIKALHDALLERQIQIICYLRRQDEQAISHYSTLVKGGRTDPFTVEDVTPENGYFNYRKILEAWTEEFGRENMIIREYARRSFVGNDICMDFLDILGADPEDFSFIEDQNISLDSHQVEVLRSVNKHLTSFSWGEWDVDMEKFEQSQRVREALSPVLPKGAHIGALMQGDTRQEVMDRFKTDNLEIVGSFAGTDFIRDWHNCVASSGSPSPQDALTVADFEKAVAATGFELEARISENDHLRTENHHLRAEKDHLRAERDAATEAFDKLDALSKKPLTSKLFKAVKDSLKSKKR